MGTCRVATVAPPKLEKSSLPIGCESVEVSAAEPAWQISGPPSPTPLSWCSRFSGEMLGLSMCYFQLLRRGALGGFGGSSDNEGSGRAHGPWISLQGLRKTASHLRSHLVAHETTCHSLLFGGKDHLVRESCRLFKTSLHSRDSVGRLGARIGHFPVDKGVLGGWSFRGPLLFCVSRPQVQW